MGHAPGQPGYVLLDRLYPGRIQSYVPEYSGPGIKSQHGPLPGLGVPLWSRACRAFTLPRELYTLCHKASGDPVQDKLHFFRALVGHPQAISEGMTPSDLCTRLLY